MTKDNEMSPLTKAQLTAWGFRLVTAALLTVGGWSLTQTVSRLSTVEEKTNQLELWRAETAGNRFTSGDGLAVWKEIADIRTRIAANEPPLWLKETLVRIERKVEGLETRMGELEKKP